MKIGFVVNKFLRGAGIAEYLYGLCECLKKTNEIYVFTPVNDLEVGNVVRVKEGSHLPLIRYFVAYEAGGIPKLDVVVSNYPTIAPVKTAMKISKEQGIPHVLIDYGVAQTEHFANLRAWAVHWVGAREAKGLYGKADRILSISRFLADQVKKMGLESRVILGGIDFQRYQKKKETGILQRFSLKREGYALFVGRASPHKGIHLVLEAPKKAGWPVKLVVVGGHPVGDYAERLKELGENNVVFTGLIPNDELDELYQNCMFYITGSLWEGLNLTLLEAQACGKPVVAFNIGAHPEVVNNGVTGFLAKPNDIDELECSIRKLVESPDLRRKMGEEGRQWARNFDWPVIANRIESELMSVAT